MILRYLDLNLLHVFDAVSRTGSNIKAAEELNLTQSAASNAICRLREHLGDRRKIIVVAAVFGSFAILLTDGGQSFAHLIFTRMGVAADESGSVAPALSVISDLYPQDKRVGAMAIFAAGNNLGVLLAFLTGGVVCQLYGWRAAFICAGVPGLVLAHWRFHISLVFGAYGTTGVCLATSKPRGTAR